MFECQINSNDALRISQSEVDAMRNILVVERVADDQCVGETVIGTKEFSNLINYYNFIKNYDIKHDFINPMGLNNIEDYEYSKSLYLEPDCIGQSMGRM